MHDADPIARFRASFDRAAALEPFDATRAAFATADHRGVPSVRFVLVKAVDARGFVVFTNTESQKGRELAENPFAALSFHWASTGEQVRVSGPVTCVSAPEADAYFASRPRGSQLSAWASAQSTAVASRAELVAQLQAAERRFTGADVTRPPHWTGYRIRPDRIEFWRDKPDRLHERNLYVRTDAGYTISLLSP
ncbi:MAG: hypothetical protein RL385_1838 [Pseudomonadota bacterium]|jgi:pyridoxamine 5'-phosphate oxidase